VNDPNAYLSGQNPSLVGPGFWELYPEDLARTQDELHHQGLRFSLEWSRIFPTATDGIEGYDGLREVASPAALARYHDILGELRSRGMRPLVTLYHYTLPTWLHDAAGCHTDFAGCTPKGWVDSERTLREAAKYAAFCAEEFGAEIDWWATLNEPLQNVLFGYVNPSTERSHPPAVKLQTAAAKIGFNALIDAHARMYDAIKANDAVDADGDGNPSFVGVVYPLVPIEPKDPNSWFGWDAAAAENIDYLWNRAYLNAVVLGQVDPNLDGQTVFREDLAGRMDYVGVNYYFGLKVSGLGFAPPVLSDLSPLFTANPLNFETTPNDPEKLKDFLVWVNEDLGRPAVITENGTEDALDDGTTPRFLVRNLKALGEAIQDGADVRGYFYWTLMDNYEWNHGMNVRMGLYAVSKDDPLKIRSARQAVPIYGEIAQFRVLSDALVDTWDAP
jgi:beta-glucosidase/6-phospho-beta-glucosidase/beta-galactosidase